MRGGLMLLAALLAGCSTSGTSGGEGGGSARSDIVLSVDRAQYRSGESMLVTLSNRSSDRVGYNPCAVALDRHTGGEWEEAPQRLTDVCTMELRTLTPGETVTFRHSVPHGVLTGDYRLRTRVEVPLGRLLVNIATRPFIIGT